MRNLRDLLCLAFGLLLVAFAAAGAQAQGVIVPGPCRRCPTPPRPVPLPRSLPVKSVQIDTKINGQVATTHVEQVFRNDTDQTLEGTYFFPIPEAASISEFAIWDGDRRLVGEVRTREEARRIYDEIVRRQRDPGLLEYAGRDLFQASIFPIPPRSDKKLELTYTQVLKAESGTVAYRYPLGTGRNVSQITGAVSGSVEVEGQKPLRNVYSPTHEIDVRNSAGGRRSRVSFETKPGREPQDFQLFYTLSDADFGMTLLTHREPGKQGYFLLTISPKEDLAEREYSAKDIVFVLDTSGSMAEAGKMEKARGALLFGVRSLKNEDRFNVVNFAGEEHLMAAGLVQADAAGRARGEQFIQQLKPVGGTNINGALQASMRLFDQQNDRPRMLVFLTDGLPTVGETKVDRIVENARSARAPGLRLFTFGVGYDVNTALLDKLAAENGGVAEYVDPKEDLEVKVSSFFTKINHPVLTALALDMGGVETDFVYPRELPDLFRGGQVTLIGRYRNPSDVRAATLALTGRAGRDSRMYPYENISFPVVNNDNEFLPRLWATRRVGWLMEQVRTNGEQKELVDEITDLGTRYGIVTPYTSYLALEPGMGVNETTTGTGGAGGGNVVTRQLGTLPRNGRGAVTGGGSGAGSGPVVASDATRMSRPDVNEAPPPPSPKEAAKATTGETAVRESRRARAQQETIRVESEADAPPTASVRKVGDKTFYLRDGVWTDSEFKADDRLPETALEFGSEDYFALVRREPQLARFFALGERVVVVFKGRVYRVGTKQ
ncbi:MAG TPA: VIT and VWA domain-containing protein [Pyrinomonadaceae bacterium]|jgi:Ca-activated chloride channel family protein|nr:VIT and VWA domain-containing protein [Pyrinomonadaceae bacterium]